MNRVRVNFKEREWKKFDEGFSVKPYISNEDELILIGLYLNELFSENDNKQFNYSRAENSMLAYLIEVNTDIELVEDGTEENPSKLLVTIDTIFENYDLWEKIERNIVNMGDFKRRLLRSVENKKEEIRLEHSLPTVIRNIYSRLQEFLQKLVDADFSDEQIQKLKDLLGEINNSDILKESINIFKKQEQKTE